MYVVTIRYFTIITECSSSVLFITLHSPFSLYLKPASTSLHSHKRPLPSRLFYLHIRPSPLSYTLLSLFFFSSLHPGPPVILLSPPLSSHSPPSYHLHSPLHLRLSPRPSTHTLTLLSCSLLHTSIQNSPPLLLSQACTNSRPFTHSPSLASSLVAPSSIPHQACYRCWRANK